MAVAPIPAVFVVGVAKIMRLESVIAPETVVTPLPVNVMILPVATLTGPASVNVPVEELTPLPPSSMLPVVARSSVNVPKPLCSARFVPLAR